MMQNMKKGVYIVYLKLFIKKILSFRKKKPISFKWPDVPFDEEFYINDEQFFIKRRSISMPDGTVQEVDFVTVFNQSNRSGGCFGEKNEITGIIPDTDGMQSNHDFNVKRTLLKKISSGCYKAVNNFLAANKRM